jgi:hypothetical protein
VSSTPFSKPRKGVALRSDRRVEGLGKSLNAKIIQQLLQGEVTRLEPKADKRVKRPPK